MKNEAEFTTQFSKFIAEYWADQGFVFEAKYVKKGTSIGLSKIQDHQLRALRMASGEFGIYHKISDESRVQKPFDGFFLKNMLAYIVVYFKQTNEFGMMDISMFNILTQRNPKKRSLTIEDFLEVGGLFCLDSGDKLDTSSGTS